MKRVNKPDRTRWQRIDVDLSSESLVVPSEDVKMQMLSQCTVCQSHVQSNFRLVSNTITI